MTGAPAPAAPTCCSRSATSSSTSASGGGMFGGRQGTVRAVDGVELHDPARRDARPRRRVGLRQDDDGPLHPAARAAHQRAGALRGPRPHGADRRRAAAAAPARAGDLPGPLQLAQSAHDGRADHRRAAGRPRPRAEPRRPARARARPARAGRAPAAARRPLPARAVGRPAAARRHRARAGDRADADRLRRAGVGARRVDPGADHQPARGSPGASSGSRTCSSRTTSPWSATSPTGSP